MTASLPEVVLPLVGARLYAAVLLRAGSRCQCEHPQCGHPTGPKGSGPRCTAEWGPGRRVLLVGPVNPGPDPARQIAASQDPDDMVARCRHCWDHVITLAKRHARKQASDRLRDHPSLF